MRIRMVKTKGLKPTEYGTRIQAIPCVTDMGASQVNVGIDTCDVHDIPSCVCRLMLSTEEARDLGQRLIATANKADAMAAEEAAKWNQKVATSSADLDSAVIDSLIRQS
jgi:hypothetical protein